MAPDAHLTVHTLFGGVAIRVPPGGASNRTCKRSRAESDVRPGSESLDAPTLTLDGRALFGGIAVGAKLPNEDEPESPDT